MKHSKKQPVLLQVLPRMESGGVERGTLQIAAAAAKAGFVSLVASEGGKLVQELKKSGAKHITLPFATKNPLRILSNTFRLKRILREKGVNIVHARSRAPAWSAYFASKRTGCHFVTTFHGYYSHRNTFKRLYNSVMTKSERVIAISQFIEEHLKNTYHVAAEKIRLIPRGTDMELFDPKQVDSRRIGALRKTWGIKKEWPVILLPGRIVRRKGHLLVLEALQLLTQKNFYCVMLGNSVGHEAYAREIARQAAASGFQEQIKLMPAVQDMPAAYAAADIVINASTEPEAFGRIPTEAMAMGKPVIATRLGGALETMIHGKTGWLVSHETPQEMAMALTEALSLAPRERSILARSCRKHIETHFSAGDMEAKTLELYYELLAKTA